MRKTLRLALQAAALTTVAFGVVNVVGAAAQAAPAGGTPCATNYSVTIDGATSTATFTLPDGQLCNPAKVGFAAYKSVGANTTPTKDDPQNLVDSKFAILQSTSITLTLHGCFNQLDVVSADKVPATLDHNQLTEMGILVKSFNTDTTICVTAPTPTPTPTPTQTVTPTPTPTVTSTPPATVTNPEGPGAQAEPNRPQLPFTGSSAIVPLTGIGIALLLAGSGAVYVARRRRPEHR